MARGTHRTRGPAAAPPLAFAHPAARFKPASQRPAQPLLPRTGRMPTNLGDLREGLSSPAYQKDQRAPD